MIMELGNIIKGHVNEILDINSDVSEERIKICYDCPLYTDRLGGICNNRLWLNIKTGDVSTYLKDGYKRGCGCRILAKTRLLHAVCPLGKW